MSESRKRSARSAAKAVKKTAAPAKAKTPAAHKSAAKLIDRRIHEFGDWRGRTLARIRALIFEADPKMIEEVKWRKPSNGMAGVPVWSHDGIVCTGEAYAKVVKLTFARGADVPDPKRLFNASLDGNTRRAIDIREGEEIDAAAFRALIQAAAAVNAGHSEKSGRKKSGETKVDEAANATTTTKAKGTEMKKIAKAAPSEKAPRTSKAKPVKLLSGGNPQIAKADGDEPVQAYIAAMPGWKSGLGKRIDAIIERNAPGVQKAVRWNSPFYGIEGQGWIVTFHVLTRYVKVTFFNGLALQPIPPGGTEKSKEARWLDIYEDDDFDEAQMAAWVKQAATLPGWIP